MTQQSNTSTSTSFHMLRAMVGIGALCGLLIVLTYEGTLPRIEQLKKEALEQAIVNVIPGITATRPFVFRDSSFEPAVERDIEVVYAGYDDQGSFKGVAIVASGQGYADVIRIIYGYSIENQMVIGFYVLESKETPGLGDKIEKDPNFLANFTSLDVSLADGNEAVKNRVITVKRGTKTQSWEIDGITGATISSRAIGEIIGNSTERWIPIIFQNQNDFLKKPND